MTRIYGCVFVTSADFSLFDHPTPLSASLSLFFGSCQCTLAKSRDTVCATYIFTRAVNIPGLLLGESSRCRLYRSPRRRRRCRRCRRRRRRETLHAADVKPPFVISRVKRMPGKPLSGNPRLSSFSHQDSSSCPLGASSACLTACFAEEPLASLQKLRSFIYSPRLCTWRMFSKVWC